MCELVNSPPVWIRSPLQICRHFLSCRILQGEQPPQTELINQRISRLTLCSNIQLSTTLTLIYLLSVGLVRLSVCAFVPRLGKGAAPEWVTYVIWGIAGFICVQTLACIIFRLTLCNPVEYNFVPPVKAGAHCRAASQQNTMMFTHALTGLAVDVTLFCLPIYVFDRLQITEDDFIRCYSNDSPIFLQPGMTLESRFTT